jgi:cholesterol oxidase
MEAQFDAVIIGSGFGGSVMAYELTNAGMSVCVLERGRRYPPGSFPRDPHGTSRNFWDPSEGFYGLFDLWSFQGCEALVSSGLGGGSLIYANVLIRKPQEWFVREGSPGSSHETWPVAAEDLAPHYDSVERILKGTPYPLGQPLYDATPKTTAFRAAANALGYDWYLPKLAVTFGNDPLAPVPGQHIVPEYPNLHAMDRTTCRLCGECDVGCNYGSKNTLDYNYLSLAHNTGRADIRTLCEARSFERLEGGGFTVHYVEHDLEREGRRTDTRHMTPRVVSGRFLVVAAGTLGTNYLLLRNRDHLPELSEQLGNRFSTNGDLLTFAFRATEPGDHGPRPRPLAPNRGPVITSTIYMADDLDTGRPVGRGFFLQDAGFPTFVSWLVEMSGVAGFAKRSFRYWLRRLKEAWSGEPETEISARIADILGECNLSHDSLPLLGMGRDVAEGRVWLRSARGGKRFLDVDWRNRRSAEYFARVTETCRRVCEQLGARFGENPDTRLLKRLITVHPLGGCSMGRTPRDGVVDSFGQVFGCDGLFIADGSVMPGPVGANPSLTIAALSRRFAARIIERWSHRGTPSARPVSRRSMSCAP